MSPADDLFRRIRDQARADRLRIARWEARAYAVIVLSVAYGVVIEAAIGALSRLPA